MQSRQKERIIGSLISLAAGLVIGIVISVVVDNALVEISLSRLFAVLFGIALCLLGGVIIWRVLSSEDQPSNRTRVVTLVFAIMVLVSGIFCFFVEKDFFVNVRPGFKVPLYAVIGTSLAFAMTFSTVELINQGVFSCSCCASNYDPKPIIGTPLQIYIVLGASLIMGLIFGFIFGTLDVEDDNRARTKLAEDRDFTIPLGAIVGGIVGFVNQWLRSQHEYAFDPLSNRGEGI
eukprot:TRINITY_DN3336_c0_g1_i1.p1 TRINITY_DN3336_c0_g1~~TRINITY_DN3336_c0_g1_i1.p1  ORF type:complete len:233 (-),score=29.23 TRINITY_DN3336_c0_g1_i1:183-881(-)